ncbi:MAG: hypothetical protein IVW36_00845 [Dehalococcoidia bacterium]|nr:hypothetical protein [Dehalococcoidia bacterium]
MPSLLLALMLAVAAMACRGGSHSSTPSATATSFTPSSSPTDTEATSIAGAIARIDNGQRPPPITEPSDATPEALGCNEAFGIVRVNQLFAALNDGDVRKVEALLPAGDSGWDFEVQPDILLRASADNATAEASDINVQTHAGLPRIMAQFADVHLVFSARLAGSVSTELAAGQPDHEAVAIGPVLWRGTGAALRERGKDAVFGGGKTAIDCRTGLFERVLLGPLRYDPP